MELTVNDIIFLLELVDRLNKTIALSTPERQLINEITQKVKFAADNPSNTPAEQHNGTK